MRFFFFTRASLGYKTKERLKRVLVADRADCSPEVIEYIQKDLYRTLSRYLQLEETQCRVMIKNQKDKITGEQYPAVIICVPFKEMNKVIT